MFSRINIFLLLFYYTDAYGVQDVVYEWKIDERNGVEIPRSKLSQFDLFNYTISKKEILINNRKYISYEK